MAAAERRYEDSRNALLRRVDWRFLLSSPEPRVAGCFSGGSLREAVELISERTGTAPGVGSMCDLVVAADLSAPTLAAASSSLRSTGWFYAECRSPFSGGPRRARRLLEAAGFTDLACYWPVPSATSPRFWVPVEAPGALRYFWDMQRAGGRPIGGIRRVARKLVWKAAWYSRVIAPLCVIGRAPPGRATGQPSPALLDLVRRGWSEWGLGKAPERLACLLVTGGNRSISKCVALIFEEQQPQPRLAVKLARVPESLPALAREAAVLNQLHARYPGVLSGIPRVLFSGAQNDHVLLVETALSGVPLQNVLRTGNFGKLAFQAADWLADFAQRTARRPSRDWYQRIAEPAIADFEATFHDVMRRPLLRRMREMLATIGPLPTISEQRDFSPWNVFLDSRGALVVLDWESAELNGLPALDLIYLLTYLAFHLERVPIDTTSPRLRGSYRRLLDPSTFTGRVRKACLAHYGRKIGIDPEQLQSLAALAWLIHSRSDFRRFAADAGGRPDQRALRRSVFLSLWEEEMQTHARSPHGLGLDPGFHLSASQP